MSANLSRQSLVEQIDHQETRSTYYKQFTWLAALAASLMMAWLTVGWRSSAKQATSAVAEASFSNDESLHEKVDDEKGPERNAASGKSNLEVDFIDGMFIDGIATVSRLQNVSWPKSARPVAVGELLKSNRWIEIESGVAEIEFGQGAVVVLEGPARFIAKSTSVGLLDYGKLAAVVPPWAEGFRIDTSSLEIVDRGTEFVVEVTPDQQVNVGVTKGEVEVWQQEAPGTFTDEAPTHRLFAGNAVHALGDAVNRTTFNSQWHDLSEQLPSRPDHTQVEVVAKYRRDFAVGIANEPQRKSGWRYYANEWSHVRDSEGYVELAWDSRRVVYDPNGDHGLTAGSRLHAANFSYRGGHPGQGRDQTRDDVDHYVIAAYQVPAAGHYRLESGWLVRAESRSDLQDQAADLRVWVDDDADLIEETCKSNGLLQFGGDFGHLQKGAWICVAVGPRGVSYNDRFEWDFAIVRTIEAIAL